MEQKELLVELLIAISAKDDDKIVDLFDQLCEQNGVITISTAKEYHEATIKIGSMLGKDLSYNDLATLGSYINVDCVDSNSPNEPMSQEDQDVAEELLEGSTVISQD